MSEGTREPEGRRPRTGTGELDEDSTAMRVRRVVYRVRRVNMGWTLLLVVLALVAGYLLGRQGSEAPGASAAAQLQQEVLPLALDADGIWTSPARDDPSVSAAMVALQQDGDAGLVAEYEAQWLEAYDALLDRIAAADVDPLGRPVQRQFVHGVTITRDAVELLGRAAAIEDEERRAALLVEVSRLRMRGEQIVQSGRAGIADLGGDGAGVSRLPELPGFADPDGDG